MKIASDSNIGKVPANLISDTENSLTGFGVRLIILCKDTYLYCSQWDFSFIGGLDFIRSGRTAREECGPNLYYPSRR